MPICDCRIHHSNLVTRHFPRDWILSSIPKTELNGHKTRRLGEEFAAGFDGQRAGAGAGSDNAECRMSNAGLLVTRNSSFGIPNSCSMRLSPAARRPGEMANDEFRVSNKSVTALPRSLFGGNHDRCQLAGLLLEAGKLLAGVSVECRLSNFSGSTFCNRPSAFGISPGRDR